ncbi:hypothetical protein [Acidovorax carolinensis]|nr:hypothetical protein [Acidovorax carolinensis]
MQRSASNTQGAAPPSLAARVRESIVLNESIITEVVVDVLNEMPAYKAEVFRRKLKTMPEFSVSIKRAAVDVGVVLALAKTFKSDQIFSESAGLIHDVDFAGHDGHVGAFAKAMVEADLKVVSQMNEPTGEGGSIFFDMVPRAALERRLALILALIVEAMKRSH